MINVNSLNFAIFENISSNQIMVDSGVVVELNTIINTDPNRTPFIGVVGANYDMEPLSFGNIVGNNTYEGQMASDIFLQVANYDRDPTEFNTQENELQDLARFVITGVRSSIAVGSFQNITNMMLNGFGLEDFNTDNTTNEPLRAKILTLNFDVTL